MDLQDKINVRIFESENDFVQNKTPKIERYFDSTDFRYTSGLLFFVSGNEYVSINFTGNGIKKLYIQDFNNEYEFVEVNNSFNFNASDFPTGEWTLCYEYLGTSYKRNFRVVPVGGLDEAKLLDAKEVIESISPGLSYDISKTNEYLMAIGDTLPNVVRLKYNLLKSRKNMIFAHLEGILEHPITNLKKIVVKGNELKKQNAKSSMLNDRKPIGIYNVVVKECNNNPENSMLYFVLVAIRKECKYIEIQFENHISLAEAELTKLSKIENDNKYYSIIKDKYSDNIKVLKESILEIEDIISKINDCIMRLGLNELSMSRKVITAAFMKNHDYHYLFDLYSLMISDRIDLILYKEGKEYFVDNKSTDVLFELYTYCMVKRILMDMGYYLVNQVEHMLNFTSLFYNADSKLEVYYNTKFLKYSSITMDYQGLINYEIYHDTPDLTIVKYDSNEKAKSIVVVEAKCRKITNVFKEDGTPNDNIMNNLYDYYKLRFKHANERISNLAVSEVICTYPFSKEKPYYEHGLGEISFIGVELTKDYKEKEFYQKLKEELNRM